MSILGILLILLLIWALLGAPADSRNMIVVIAIVLLLLWAVGAFGFYYPAHPGVYWP
jgi:uncharacterized membrane protein